jgi:lipopolysaccharide/colanic/teichoic acid biosynthesis glycosyltransferase
MPFSLSRRTNTNRIPLRRKASNRTIAALSLLLAKNGYRWSKRLLDIIGGMLLLICSFPVMLLIAIAIKLDDGGPVLHFQRRVGRHGCIFRFPKFRSMRLDAEKLRSQLMEQNHHGDSLTFKMRRDPRVTRVGRVIRRFSLDELPQLICVLFGHMSLVGPRPALPAEVEHYSVAHRRRLDVLPGLTCIWQVSGRADVPFEGQVKLDVEYIESQSLPLDLRLILITIPAMLTGRGAY